MSNIGWSSLPGIYFNTLSGVIDGVNTVFQITNSNIDNQTLIIFYHGMTLSKGVDYNVSGSTITFTFAPIVNSILLSYYLYNNSNDNYIIVAPSGLLNGVNTTFTLPSIPDPPLSLQLFYNGSLLKQGLDYTLINSAITLNFIPITTSLLLCSYRIYSNISSNNLYATSNDIISYNGNSWNITFNASDNIGNIQFVFDNNSNTQIQWNGNAWVNGWYGPYTNENWRLII